MAAIPSFSLSKSHESKKKILCLPQIKVLEDGLIIGLLTETNDDVDTISFNSVEPQYGGDKIKRYLFSKVGLKILVWQYELQ